MSTKIYNGLRVVDPSMDIFELTRIVSTAIHEQFHVESLKVIAREVFHNIDSPE